MFEINGLMKTNYLLEKTADVESLRKKVIANNIANVDVPHFKRSEVNFESELKRTIQHNKQLEGQLDAYRTDDRHLSFGDRKNLSDVNYRINLDYNTTFRNDGNNVDVEKEMVDSSKSQMRYNAAITGLAHNFKMLKISMKTVA